MKAFVTVTQQQFDISAEQGVPEFSAFVTVSQEQFIIIVQDPTGDVLTQSVEFGNFIKGKDGTIIYNGSGVPANTLGVNGDLYIDNIAPNNYYEKISGVWVLQGHLQGEAGAYTVITIGENGNWYIDGEDSGQRAIGVDGYTPIIGENDNWWINGVDTGKRAVGIDGVGILSWQLVSTVGKVKTYRITFTDSNTFEYTIEDGADGHTPIITVGENGNWYVDGTDTGTKAQGEKGDKPVITVGLNGNWFVDGTDTGTKAQGENGITPTIGENKHWFIGATDTGIVAEGKDGEDGVSPILTIGINGNWYINGSDTGVKAQGEKGDTGTSAYEIYIAGGGTLSEVDYNASITNIPTHIADTTIHHTIDDLDVLYEPKNSNIQSHISDTDIHVTTTDKSNWDAKADLDEVLKLDQSTPQTITQSPKITALTAGQLVYVNADKQLVPVAIYWDAVNNRIGFGTDNPSSALHVSSPVFPVQIIERTTPAQGNIYAADRTIRQNSSGLSDLAGVAKYFALSDKFGGLQHAGSFGTKWLNSTTRTLQMFFNIGNGGVDPSTGTEKMVVNGTGEVGIGTTTPKSKLQVAGGIQCGDDTAAASADKVGTIRQRDVNNNTLLEFCKNTAGVYEWEKINDKLSLDQTTPQTLTQSPKIDSLTAGQLVYVNADKQLVPIPVYWDFVNNRMGVGANNTRTFNITGIDTQFRINYDAANYVDIQCSSTGHLNLRPLSGRVYCIASSKNNAMYIYDYTDGSSSYSEFSGSVLILRKQNVSNVQFQNNGNGFIRGDLGLGTTTPKSKLQVAGGIQCGDDTAAASIDKVGTTRYRATANASYVEMCMQVGASSYSWVVIVTNTW